MRYRTAPKIAAAAGDTRTRARFLLWPKKVGDEWRWLEMGRWTQRLVQGAPVGAHSVRVNRWIDVSWEG